MNLTTGHDVDRQGNIVMLEISLHFIGIGIVYNLISDEETSVPLLVDVGEVGVLGIEDAVDELEACGKNDEREGIGSQNYT